MCFTIFTLASPSIFLESSLAAVSKEHDSVCGTHRSQVRPGSVLPIAGAHAYGCVARSTFSMSLCATMAAWMGARPPFSRESRRCGVNTWDENLAVECQQLHNQAWRQPSDVKLPLTRRASPYGCLPGLVNNMKAETERAHRL